MRGVLSFFRRSRFEPIDHVSLVGLLTYGSRPADFDEATIKTLRLNAGKMPDEELADAMCWSLGRLRAVCKSAVPPIPLCYQRTSEKEPEPRGA